MADEIKLVVSDFHLGTGIKWGLPNTYEEFFVDDRFKEFLEYYSSGEYTKKPVELIIAGDFVDFLKIPYKGQFIDEVDELIATDKMRRAIKGHPVLFDALKEFIHKPNKRVTYLIGNHDQDIVFPMVQRLMRARLGVKEDSDRLVFRTDDFYYRLPGGVIVTHGHQFETMNRFEPNEALIEKKGRVVVNYPIGSRFVATVIAPAKKEEPLMGLVIPLSLFLLYEVFFKFTFAVRVITDMMKFFLKSWIKPGQKGIEGLITSMQVLYEQTKLYSDLDEQAIKFLRASDDIRVLIAGHSHVYKVRRYPGDNLYINTGTWTKFVNMELENFGTKTYLTYAEVRYSKDSYKPMVRLMRWRGEMRKFEDVPG